MKIRYAYKFVLAAGVLSNEEVKGKGKRKREGGGVSEKRKLRVQYEE